MSYGKMTRVSKANLCPVCGRGDWCLAAADGSAAICPRVEQGSIRKCGEAGWLHILKDARNSGASSKSRPLKRRISITSPVVRDFDGLAERYRKALTPDLLKQQAKRLGLSVEGLKRLGAGWNGRGLTFPMRDARGKVIGIRIRYPTSSKAAVTGSRNGLFVPDGLNGSGLLLVAEGVTDCAALFDLGFAAVGRPSCNGGRRLILDFVRPRRPTQVVVLFDGDGPGREGAQALVSTLLPFCPCLRSLAPPAGIKDARDWKQAGATHGDVAEAIARARVWKLGISVENRSRRPGSAR